MTNKERDLLKLVNEKLNICVLRGLTNKKILEWVEDIILFHSPEGLSDEYYLELYKLREKFK